ncbi:MAG TPA: mannosyltransferase family protein [Dokdonella sp.]|uniref:mannosyltransferase family protein n=1 Tax=Dokdonella sp. TaxID=2291710 RepID=UPI002C6DE400|nr:mannosyltransferase family protein [Dokdonella sp.]HUD41310.1 mannosyltransferase family protein [Dokdonella sp.]
MTADRADRTLATPAVRIPGAGASAIVRAIGPGLARLADSPLAAILALYAVSRLALLAIGGLTVVAIDPAVYIGAGRSLLCRWDCGWYLEIVRHGYSMIGPVEQPGQTTLAFFPVYPLLIGAVSALLGIEVLPAALLVSNLCFVAALVYVYRYAQLLGCSRPAGLFAVALICFVPQGFVFSAAYTESLFLLLLAGAMYHVRRGQFLIAGLLAAVLSGVRANGVFFVFFMLLWIVRHFGVAAFLTPWRRPQLFVPIVLAPLGLFCFWAYCFALTGDAFAQASSVAHGWGWQSDLPWINVWNHLRTGGLATFWVLCSLGAFAASLLLLRLRMYEEFGLCLAILLLLWSGQIPNSLLRYCIVLFPIAIGLARHLDGRPLTGAVLLACFALLNGFLMTAWTLGNSITI